MSDREPREPGDRPISPDSVRAVRTGHGANCSSIGSVVDTLFASAVLGGAVFAMVLAAMKRETIRVVGEEPGAEKRDGERQRPEEG